MPAILTERRDAVALLTINRPSTLNALDVPTLVELETAFAALEQDPAVHAIVVPQEGATLTESEIIEHTKTRIAGFKVPKSVVFRSEPLPLSGAMKVLKRDLRAPYWEGQDRSVG